MCEWLNGAVQLRGQSLNAHVPVDETKTLRTQNQGESAWLQACAVEGRNGVLVLLVYIKKSFKRSTSPICSSTVPWRVAGETTQDLQSPHQPVESVEQAF
jgi:hypothetical protein